MRGGRVSRAWRLLLLLCGPLVTCAAHADAWTVMPEISLEESLNDNVRLTRQDKDSDLISVVSPGVAVKRDGRRLDLSANYQLQGIFYRNFSGQNRNVNLIDANANAELLREHLFLDAMATRSEQNVGNVGTITLDNTSLGGTRARVDTYRVSPYWRQAVGNLLETEIRYERNSVTSTALQDSDSDLFKAVMESGRRFNRLMWDGSYTDQEISGTAGTSTRFRNTAGTLQYLITEKFSIKATGGYDDNQYANNSQDTGGRHWLLGGVYRPSVRTSFEAGAGERYFGRDVLVELSHRHRKFQWQIAYHRQPDTTRSILLEQPVFPVTDVFNEDITDPLAEQPPLLDFTLPEQAIEVFIRSRLNGTLNYVYRKNSVDVTIFSDKRESQLTGLADTATGSDITWVRRLGGQMEARLMMRLSRDETAASDRDIRILSGRLSRSLTADLKAELTWRYTDVESSVVEESYRQNTIIVSLRKQF